MEQVLQGKIGRFTLPEIFQLIANGRRAGTLGIQRDDDIVMVYFRNGRIIYAYGPRQTSHLGRLLRDNGKITAEQLDEAVSIQSGREPSKRLGQILIEKNFIDRADLIAVISRQVEELIYSLLSWESGSFKFYENQYPTEEEITVDLSAENVILEGIRRIDEINRLKEALPDFDTILRIAPAIAGIRKDISLDMAEWNVLALVDGARSISEIVDVSVLPEMETLEKLAALKLAGLIEKTERKVTEFDHLNDMVDRLSGLLEDYLGHRTGEIHERVVASENIGDDI
jgi:hypothetical protein